MSGSYRRDIDGLRAVAVVLVLAVHAFPSRVPNGFIGVDLFFVISGFLITGILIDELESNSFSINKFYVRRINRLFPALLLVLIATLCVGAYATYPTEYSKLNLSAWLSSLFAANIGFFIEAGYWDVSSKVKPLLHLWSLGVEEQFYLLWPLLLWLAFRNKLPLLQGILSVILLSLALNIYLTHKNHAAAFYLPFGRLWELAAGGLLAWWQRQGSNANVGKAADNGRGIGNVMSWGALLLLVVGQITPINAGEFPGYYTVIVVLTAVLFIAAGPNAWLNRRLLSQPILVYVGKLSYPLYLWHWPLLVLARLAGEGQWSSSHRNLAVTGAFALAVLTYHGVEQPLAKIRQRGRLAVFLMAMMVGVGAVSALVYTGVLSIGVKPYLVPAPGKLKHLKPDIHSAGKIVLLGDSNAGHLEWGLRWIYGDRLQVEAIASWPNLDGIRYREGKGKATFAATVAATDKKLQRIADDSEVRLVIISNAYSLYMSDNNMRSVEGARDDETSSQAYEAAMRRTAKRFLSHGKEVIVVESIPTYPGLATVMACDQALRPWLRHRPEGCTPSRESVEAGRRQYRDLLNRAFEDLPQVYRLNTLDQMCDERTCYVNRDGEQLYFDGGHFSAEGSEIVSAALARQIERMLKPQ